MYGFHPSTVYPELVEWMKAYGTFDDAVAAQLRLGQKPLFAGGPTRLAVPQYTETKINIVSFCFAAPLHKSAVGIRCSFRCSS
ncbi:hypothetical protein Landi51_11291 [Colletotrichum acutatum]